MSNKNNDLIEETIQRISISVLLSDIQKDDFRKFINEEYDKIVNFNTNKMSVLFDDYYEIWTHSPYEKAIEFNKKVSSIPRISFSREVTKGNERKNFFKRL